MSTRNSRPRIHDDTKARALKMLKEGMFKADISRSLGISEYSVWKIAQVHGIKYARCPIGSRWGKQQGSKVMATTAERNWAGEIANARWGAGHGA